MGDPYLNDDENDPLLQWGASLLGGQQLSAPSTPALSAESMQPAPAPAPAAPPQNDYGALEALAGLGPPPKSDGTANNIAMALAMLADAALNKGRTIGPIMGAWASRKDPALESYELRMSDAMKRAQMAHLMGQGQDAAANREARNAEIAARNRALDLEARKLDQLDKNGGMTAAQAQEIELRRQQIEDMRAARADSAQLRRDQMGEASASRAEREAERADAAKLRQDNLTAENARKFTKDSAPYRDIASEAQGLEEIAAQNPDDMPGIGKLKGHLPDWLMSGEGQTVRNKQRWLGELVLHAQSGKAAPMSEVIRNQIMSGADPTATDQQFKIALKSAEDYARNNIRSQRVGREGVADQVLSESGLGSLTGDSGGQGSHEPPSGKVLVQAPPENGEPGKVGYIPADKLQEALRRGARRIQ